MKSLIELKATEKIMAILGLCIFVISLLLGYRLYALGVALAASISWLFYRWQIITVANGAGLPPRKAANRLIAGSIIRLVVLLILLGLSSLGGEAFLFGVLTGFLLQVMAYTGQALCLLGRLSKSRNE
jgi:hypothetical protein